MTTPSDRPSAPADERRVQPRLAALMPARVRVADRESTALIRDVSSRGALVYTQERLESEAEVELDFFFTDDLTTPQTTRATVVRSAVRDPRSAGIWAYSAALRFDEVMPNVEAAATALAARQSAFGLLK